MVNLRSFPAFSCGWSAAAQDARRFRYIRSVRGVRICDTRMAIQLRGNHAGGAVRAYADGGLNIAKLITGIVDRVGDWISDD